MVISITTALITINRIKRNFPPNCARGVREKGFDDSQEQFRYFRIILLIFNLICVNLREQPMFSTTRNTKSESLRKWKNI